MVKMKKMLKGMAGLMIGIPLIGAASEQTNAMSSGTAKTIAGAVVGLGSVALVGHSMKMLPKLPLDKSKIPRGKLKW
jgi:hypothetical protein